MAVDSILSFSEVLSSPSLRTGKQDRIFFIKINDKFSSSVRYTETTLGQALEYLKTVDANLGGTEIYNALHEVYRKEPVLGYARKVRIHMQKPGQESFSHITYFFS